MASSIKRILVATDGSEGALRAANFAADLARNLDAAVTIFVVHDENYLLTNAMGPTVWPGAIPDVSVDIEALKSETEAQAATTSLKDTRACFADIPNVDTKQAWGHAAEAICDYAAEEHFDMVVLGSRGRSAFARLLLGSVSTQVAHHSPCPVTIVH